MAMTGATNINVGVSFDLDKNSYNQLMSSLEKINAAAEVDKVNKNGQGLDVKLQKASAAATELQKIMDRSWDHKLNQVNLTKLNNEFKKSKTTATEFFNKLSQGSTTGVAGANEFARAILNSNIELTKTNQLLDKMAVTFGNTIRYGISSSVFNTFTNSIRNAYEYTKQLDTSLNDIRIVSGKSAEEMAELAVHANNAAQALGRTTLDYTKAATIFYQQGLPTDEVEKRTEIVLKAANVTGQSAAEVSEQLTSVWNGYQVPLEQLELYIDKLSAVAASSASNLEELSSGMSKVASAANVMGVNIDQLTAQMSTIISVTRQAPESVGTALRTIYARMADIKAGMDDEITLGNYSGKMKKLGFDVLDASGNLKDMGEVIEEIGGKWDTLSREQQVSLAQIMAGTRQYNNLLTLFDNWDKYEKALNTSADAAGTLQKQQDIYMESTEAHLKQLTAEAEELYATLFDQDTARAFIDLINGALKGFNNYIKALGGGFNSFLGMGSQVANLFSGQIASWAAQKKENWDIKQNQNDTTKIQEEIANAYLAEGRVDVAENTEAIKAQAAEKQKILGIQKYLNQEQLKELNEHQKMVGLLETERIEAEKRLEKLNEAKGKNFEKYKSSFEALKEEDETFDLDKSSIVEQTLQNKRQTVEDLENDIKKLKSQATSQDINEEEIANIEKQIKAKIEQRDEEESYVQALEKRYEILQKVDKEEKIVDDSTKQKNAHVQEIDNAKKLADRQKNIKTFIKNGTAILQATTVWVGALQTFGNEAASTEEKVSAGYNAVVGSISAAVNAWIPGAGLLVQMAGGLLDSLGITKGIAELFKTEAEREQEKITELQEFAERMSQEYATLNQEVDTLKSKWESYSSVVEILNNCQEGTEKWNNALKDVNKTILELLETYPELLQINGMVTTGENGQIVLNENLYKQYIQDVYNQAVASQTASLLASHEAKVRSNNLRSESVRKDSNLTEDDFTKLVNSSADIVQYKKDVEELSKTIDLQNKSTEQFTSEMMELRTSLVSLNNTTKNLNNEFNNSVKILAASTLGNSSPSGLRNVWYAQALSQAYTQASGSKYNADFMAKIWAYGPGTVGGGYDLENSSGTTSKAYLNIVRDLNEAAGYKKYDVAQGIDEADVVQGDDGDEGITIRDLDLGKNVTYSRKDWAKKYETHYIQQSIESNNINKNIENELGYLSHETGLDTSLLEKIFQEDFNINKLTKEEAGQLTPQVISDIQNHYFKAFNLAGKEEGEFNEGQQFANDFWNNVLLPGLTGEWDPREHEKELKEAFNKNLKSAAAVASEDYGLDSEEIVSFGKHLASIAKDPDVKDLADTLETDGRAVAFVAQSIMRMNDGIEDLNKSQEEWLSILKKSDKASEEYWRAVVGLQNAFGDLLNLTKEGKQLLDGDFFEENAELIKQAANGSAEAIDKLRKATFEEIVAKIEIKTDDYTREQLKADIDNIQSLIDGLNLTLEPGVEINDKSFIDACNQMIEKAGWTTDQVNTLFSAMGYDATVVEETDPVKSTIPVTTKHHKVTNYTEKDGVREWDEVETISQTDEPVTTELGAWAFQANPKGASKTPKIKKITRGANGNNNNYSPKNPGGKGLGGGKGGSSSKPSKKDPNKDELDRYQLVNVQLKEISKELTKLDKEKNKLLGGNLLKNLNNQIKLLNDQITVTEAKLKIAKDEQSEVAGKLAGYGIKFDSQGNIANYAQIFKQEQAKLNAVYDAFNGMSKDAQESYQDTVKAAEETWKTFKDSISKYDNLIGETIPQLQQDIRDAFDKQTEIFIEEFNMEVKLRLDTSSMLRDWNEFRRKVIDGIKDDDILGTAKAKLADFESYYNAAGTAEIQALTKRLQQQLEEVRKQDATGSAEWYRDNRAKAIEDLKDNYDKIRASLEEIIKLEEEMQQKVLDMINEAQEKFDEQIGTFENINKHLEHNIELINLLTDQNDYEALAKQYEAQTKNREQELDFYTKQKDYWENYLKTLEEGSKEWEEAKAKYNEAAEAWASAIQTTIEAARKEFENNINLIFKTINNQLTDNKGLDYLNTEWELLKDNSDMVLDNINKMQKFQDLTQKYNDAINSTSNIAAQKKLAQLRDQELAALKEIDNISEKDLERAEKKLDIVKAQIALEDAQRNKTQMRLRRDSQGNYRYQFVADEEEVQKAQQDLANAYNELYNFDKERYQSNLNDAYAAWNEYQEKMAEAALINDPEVRGQREELLTKEYNERILILTEENERIKQELNESTIAELNSLYAQNADNYDLMTEEQKAALSDYEAANQTAFDLIFDLYTENTKKFHDMTQDQLDVIENQMIPQWTSGYQTLIDKIEGEGGIEEVSAGLTEQLHNEAEEYQNDLSDIEIAAGQTFGEISDTQNDIIENTKDMLEANDGLIDKYTEMTDAVMDQYTALKDLMNEYEQAANDAKQAAEDAYNYIMKDKNQQAEEAKENVDAGPTTGGTGNYNPTPEPTQTSTPAPTVKTPPATPFSATLSKGTALYRADGSQYPRGTQADRTVTVKTTSGSLWQVWGSTFDPHTVYIKKSALGYDTGGYTGAWGDSGRLAFLHQKELVLNKEDTTNMLNAVEILRGITENISADVLGKIAGASSIGINGSMGNGALDQNVHITATFPGVQSSIEIQDALNNLVNMAAQRAQVK